MSDEFEMYDEDADNPFDLFESLGWQISDEDDDENSEAEDDESLDWDHDVYWANYWLLSSRFGDWGQFANGLACDGSRDLSDIEESDELSLFEHVRLVMDMRSEARRDSQPS